MVIDADGKILIASEALDHVTVGRYNADGSRETTFADDGLAGTDVVPGYHVMEEGTALAIQSDGKVVVVGHVQFYSEEALDHADFMVIRLDAGCAGPATVATAMRLPLAPATPPAPSQPVTPADDGENSEVPIPVQPPGFVAPQFVKVTFSAAAIGERFDFDDPAGKKDDLDAPPQETLLS
jgi:hypothetical protein